MGVRSKSITYLIVGAKCYAAIQGKYSPDIEDVKAIAKPILGIGWLETTEPRLKDILWIELFQDYCKFLVFRKFNFALSQYSSISVKGILSISLLSFL